MAVFHGRNDRNCPFELTEEAMRKLEGAGANVMYRVDDNIGHSPPQDKTIMEEYYTWLRAVVSR